MSGEVYTKVTDVRLRTSYFSDHGTIIASQTLQMMSMVRNAWICPSLEDEFITISDYVEPKYPSVYTWMAENMRHDMESYDPETYDPVILPDVWQTGTTYSDANLSVLVSSAQNSWDFESDSYFFSYIVPLEGGTSAAFDKAINTFSVKAAKNGAIRINGAAAHLDVYDLNGRRVYSIDNPKSEVSTGLSTGLYIIKAIGKDGSVITTKAAI